MNRRAVHCLAVLAIAACACGRSSSSAPASSEHTGVTSRQPAAPKARFLGTVPGIDAQAVDELAQSWCDQQRGCDQIGEKKPYADFESCMSRMRGVVHDDLDAFHCSHGLDSLQTQSCMSAIHLAACARGDVALPALPACRSEALCAK